MRRLWKFVAFVFALILLGQPAWAERRVVPLDELKPTHEHQQSALVIVKVIDRYHYRGQPGTYLTDESSEQILNRYLESLDPNRSFFLASDIAAFSQIKNRLDDYIKAGQVEPAFQIFRVYRQRVGEAVAHAKQLLEKDFDFTVDENYQFDRSKSPWALTQAELDDIWRKRVKNDFLGLRMTKKPDAEIRKTLAERYDRLQLRVEQFDANDVFQTFINAFAMNLEPHTSYMSPSTSENFDISMRLSLEGIGAVLSSEDEYTVVEKTVVGGPAKLSGQIHAGDRIVGVGQGIDGKIEDIIGWRLQDVVEQIRGPKGSVVRLMVLPKDAPADGAYQEITLVRNKIKLEEQAAKSSIIEGLNGMDKLRIGVIEVPTFYRDFAAESRGDVDFRSTTRDVRQLLAELKAKGVNGIVIDLRQNGGGSLAEATELTGLFIKSGPVVQIKDVSGRVDVELDPDENIAYDGPLAVLVDRNSASASEIFAGAIQDYNRGIVIGEPTYGKGTVQTLVDLRRFVPGSNTDLGRLRLTMAQFFRINGDSTQHRGVVPDIQFPMAVYTNKHGERSLDNALPWAAIDPAKYPHYGVGDYAYLLPRYEQRVKHSPGFEMLVDQEKQISELEESKEVTLLESKRRAEWEEREQNSLTQKNRFRVAHGMAAVNKDETVDDKDVDEAEQEAANHIQLDEAARILADSINFGAPMAVMR